LIWNHFQIKIGQKWKLAKFDSHVLFSFWGRGVVCARRFEGRRELTKMWMCDMGGGAGWLK
jgi:hypothetical protein